MAAEGDVKMKLIAYTFLGLCWLAYHAAISAMLFTTIANTEMPPLLQFAVIIVFMAGLAVSMLAELKAILMPNEEDK